MIVTRTETGIWGGRSWLENKKLRKRKRNLKKEREKRRNQEKDQWKWDLCILISKAKPSLGEKGKGQVGRESQRMTLYDHRRHPQVREQSEIYFNLLGLRIKRERSLVLGLEGMGTFKLKAWKRASGLFKKIWHMNRN